MKRLILSQKGSVNKYLEKVNILFYYHKIDKKIDKLKLKWNQIYQKYRSKRLNKIDNEYLSLLLSLEYKCHKLWAGAEEFSPGLSKAGLT